MPGKIIAVANQKGGVGKTTTTINLSIEVARLGKQSLIVDFDPQGNCSSGLGVELSEDDNTIYDYIVGNCSFDEAVHDTPIENCKILPANINLAGATVELIEQSDREKFLKKGLQAVVNRFDYIFIDCPPSLGIITLNALAAAESILIPIQTEFFALEGLTQLINTINNVKKQINPKLAIEGVLLTMLDKRTHLTEDVTKNVVGYFGKKVYKTMIPRNVKLAEAPSFGLPVSLHDPNCVGAKAYQQLAREFING